MTITVSERLGGHLVVPCSDWDFRGANTDCPVHRLHPYPARMAPQLARQLVGEFCNSGDLIFDPFCGSGTALLEALRSGHSCVGVDINPLATLISRVKVTPIQPDRLRRELTLFVRLLRREFKQDKLKRREPPQTVMDFDVSYWFDRRAIGDLAKIRHCLERGSHMIDPDVIDLLRLCFSRTVREVSRQRLNEFKPWLKVCQARSPHPDAVKVFLGHVLWSAESLATLFRELPLEVHRNEVTAQVVLGDNRTIRLRNRVDVVITSPPYGDSPTTVAYGQFSRASLLWLGYDNRMVHEIDRTLLAEGSGITSYEVFSPTLHDDVIPLIASVDRRRASVVLKYFACLQQSIESISGNMNGGGRLCLVVGSRTVRGVVVPTPRITMEICAESGFELSQRITRNISRKVLPRRNEKQSTINEEDVMIFRRE